MHIAHVNVCGTDMKAGGGACAGLQRGTSVPALATTPASRPATTTQETLTEGNADSCEADKAEDRVLEALTRVIDEDRGREVEAVIKRGGHDGRNLKGHIKSLFKANSEEGTRMNQGDWYLFCRLIYGKAIPKFEDVLWPPGRDAWLDFLLELRPQVSSYKRFQGVIGNVCEVANRYWSCQLEKDACAIDPRVLYCAEQRRAMHTIKREYGLGVKQVEAIDMREAQSACNFVDAESLRGMAAAASFSMGCLMGGRRPRTLTCIKLGDVEFRAQAVKVRGVSTCAAGVAVTFREEKYDDIQGVRSARDYPEEQGDFEKHALKSCAFWLYRMLVLRDCFVGSDPIRTADDSERLPIKPQCLEFYLFCEVTQNLWVDTAPVSTHTISWWTKGLLERMGSRPRGFSAHRSGVVTRACILAILESEGKELPPGRLDVIIRWGGWQCVTGEKTVMRIYARKVIDAYLNNYGMSYGRVACKDEWAQKLVKYSSAEVHPERKCFDRGRHAFPMQMRLHAWRGRQWQAHLQEMNNCMAAIMKAAKCNADIMPVARYVQDRKAMNLYCEEMRKDPNVLQYKKLKRERVQKLFACIQEVVRDCALEAAKWVGHTVDRVYWTQQMWIADVRMVVIGNISLDCRVEVDDLHAWHVDGFKFRVVRNAVLDYR